MLNLKILSIRFPSIFIPNLRNLTSQSRLLILDISNCDIRDICNSFPTHNTILWINYDTETLVQWNHIHITQLFLSFNATDSFWAPRQPYQLYIWWLIAAFTINHKLHKYLRIIRPMAPRFWSPHGTRFTWTENKIFQRQPFHVGYIFHFHIGNAQLDMLFWYHFDISISILVWNSRRRSDLYGSDAVLQS